MRRGKGARQGIGIIAAILMILIVSVMALTVVSMVGSGNATSLNYLHSQQALFVAEGGLQYYLEQLQNDDSWISQPSKAEKALGSGTFTITTSNASADEIDVTSTGEVTGFGGITVVRAVSAHAVRGVGVPEAFNYNIHTFGAQTRFTGSSGTIQGDLAASGSLTGEGGMSVGGDTTESSTVADPGLPSMTLYESLADNVESGGFIFTSGSTYGASGSEEIWYIQGDVTIQQNVTIYGTVVSENNITLGTTGITIDAASGYPALIADKNIVADGLDHSAISGLIYAESSVDFDNFDTVTITGTILVGSTLNMRTGSAIVVNYDADLISNPPPGFLGGGVSISNWDEVY